MIFTKHRRWFVVGIAALAGAVGITAVLHYRALYACQTARKIAAANGGAIVVESHIQYAIHYNERIRVNVALFPYVSGISLGPGPTLRPETIQLLAVGGKVDEIQLVGRVLSHGVGKSIADSGPVQSLMLSDCEVAASDLADVLKPQTVRNMTLLRCGIRGDVAEATSLAATVTQLQITGRRWSARGMRSLPQHNVVKVINLSGASLSDADLPALPAVELLDLTGTQVDGSFLANGMVGPSLFHIKLGRTRANDAALQFLASETVHPTLIDMAQTSVSSKGVSQYLRAACGPETAKDRGCDLLRVAGCKGVDDGIYQAVVEAECLKSVDLRATSVTPQAIDGIERQRPDLLVVYE